MPLVENQPRKKVEREFFPRLNKNLICAQANFLVEKLTQLLPLHLTQKVIILADKLISLQNIFIADKVNRRKTSLLADKTILTQTNHLADKIISSQNSSLTDKPISESPIALCLDLGTQTGWALASREKIITSGSKNFKGNRFQSSGIKFLKFIGFLDDLFNYAKRELKIIFFETVRRHLGVDAAHAYGGFLGHLTAWCEKHGIAYEGVPVGTIKRHATGKGNASKAVVIESIKKLNHKPIDDNEADALALAYWALENRLRGL